MQTLYFCFNLHDYARYISYYVEMVATNVGMAANKQKIWILLIMPVLD